MLAGAVDTVGCRRASRLLWVGCENGRSGRASGRGDGTIGMQDDEAGLVRRSVRPSPRGGLPLSSVCLSPRMLLHHCLLGCGRHSPPARGGSSTVLQLFFHLVGP